MDAFLQLSSIRFGRGRSSPPQLGQVSFIAVAQSGQNVHSKLHMRASPFFGVGAWHFSHSAFISFPASRHPFR
jgi:hypothetical protein